MGRGRAGSGSQAGAFLEEVERHEVGVEVVEELGHGAFQAVEVLGEDEALEPQLPFEPVDDDLPVLDGSWTMPR